MRPLKVVALTAVLLMVMAAAPPSPPKVTGTVFLAEPTQVAKFAAFDTDPAKGEIGYTNFDFPTPGTRVWVPDVDETVWIAFYLCQMPVNEFPCTRESGPYWHGMVFDSFSPQSLLSVSFEGDGWYGPDPDWTWTVIPGLGGELPYPGITTQYYQGAVAPYSYLEFTMLPDDGGAKYGWTYTNLWARIHPNGFIEGQAADSLGRLLEWEIVPGSVHEVFHYTVPVTSASVDRLNRDARFEFTIPAGLPYAGTLVCASVHDGGPPGEWTEVDHDTWAHKIGSCTGDPGQDYPVVGGNLTVH